jgi:tetratricopeptide (TPR) repeat protein
MELILIHDTPGEILVICDQQRSHTFLLWQIASPDEELPFHDPIAYGRTLHKALFPPNTGARHALAQYPDRIMLVAEETDLDAIPWEYLYGSVGAEELAPEGFLVTEMSFVRGLPEEQRIVSSTVERDLHIVAVPSDPLSEEIARLDVEAEWIRLKGTVASLPFELTLENTYPPTIEQLASMVKGHHQRVVHFMGHGQQRESGAVLCFEKENGDLDPVEAQPLIEHIHASVFLVTLNACVSAASGKTNFSNLASALAHRQIPYALGMRFRIGDDDARTFSHAFYTHLARGASVEIALCQARRSLYQTRLALNSNPFLGSVGVPVLYTSLATPAAGFVCKKGKPVIKEHQPPTEISLLPHAKGIFQGRTQDLKQLGTYLTGTNCPSLLTIHGGRGSGKTALVHEAIKRFAFVWPAGVWVISLAHLPDYAIVVTDLAHFLNINTQEIKDSEEVERQVLAQLMTRRILIVLDNAEILVDAIQEKNDAAIMLTQFFQRLMSTSAHLLVTSRYTLGWSGEIVYESGGLKPEEGANFFRQCAPQRIHQIDQITARKLSEQVGGYPLSLRLLGSAFNSSHISLSTFLEENAEQLRSAEDRDEEHHDYSLTSALKINVLSLDDDLRKLLRGLYIFHAPFLAEAAIAVFDPATQETESTPSSVRSHLHQLWERGLLERREIIVRDGHFQLYALLPNTRFSVNQVLELADEQEEVMRRFGAACAMILAGIHQELDRRASVIVLAHQCGEDLERGWTMLTGLFQGWYLYQWGWVVSRLGNPRRGIPLLERAFEIFQMEDDRIGEAWALVKLGLVYERIGEQQQARDLSEEALPMMKELGNRSGEATVLNNIAAMHDGTGQRERALALYEEALSIRRELGDHIGEAIVLNNMALIYTKTGQPQQALALYKQTLPVMRETEDHAGEAATLHNMAWAYQRIGQSQRALELYEQALPIMKEIGDSSREASIRNNIAMIYSESGQLPQAMEIYKEALSIAKKAGDRTGEAAALNNMAVLYARMGERKRALELYKEILLIIKKLDNRPEEATVLNNMAQVYSQIGQLQQALELYEETLPIMREVGDRVGEAITLNNVADVHIRTGRLQQALELYEEALLIMREAGDRIGEATTLNNMAEVYGNTGQPQRALELYEQALPMSKEIGDRAREAMILHNMAATYQNTGQLQQALARYEEAQLIGREIGDRVGEVTTLNNIAEIYQSMGQSQRALELHEQALPIRREIGDRAGEATTLHNIAWIYSDRGQSQQALVLYEEALLIMREIGNHVGEATILNGQASLYENLQRYDEASHGFEASIQLARAASNPILEALGLSSLGMLLYRYLNKPTEAIAYLQAAITLLQKHGLPDAAGLTVEQLQQVLATMEQSSTPQKEYGVAALPNELVQQLIVNTITVMTIFPDHRPAWREQIIAIQHEAQQREPDWQMEFELCTALLDLLAGRVVPPLPVEHPYALALAAIQYGIAIQEK